MGGCCHTGNCVVQPVNTQINRLRHNSNVVQESIINNKYISTQSKSQSQVDQRSFTQKKKPSPNIQKKTFENKDVQADIQFSQKPVLSQEKQESTTSLKIKQKQREQFSIQKINTIEMNIKKIFESKDVQTEIQINQKPILSQSEQQESAKSQNIECQQQRREFSIQRINLIEMSIFKKTFESKDVQANLSIEINLKSVHQCDKQESIQNNEQQQWEQFPIIQFQEIEQFEQENFPEIEQQDTLINLQLGLSLQQFIKFKSFELKRERTKYQMRKTLIDFLEIRILENNIKINDFIDIARQNEIEVLDLLTTFTKSDITLLEMTLLYIEDYDIIQFVILHHKLPSLLQLHQVALNLINKMKPFQNNNKKIIKTIEFLRSVKYKKETLRIMSQLSFTNFDSYINLNDRLHLKLFKLISFILYYSNIDLHYLGIYWGAKQMWGFKQLELTNSIKLGQSKIQISEKLILLELSFNIFHQIALSRKWEQFLQYFNEYYLLANNSEITPFLMMFRSAPLEIINCFISQYSQALLKGMQYSTRSGYNLIHSLCQNKYLHSNINEVQKLFTSLIQNLEALQILLIQSYQEQIPLVYYLDQHKQPQTYIIQFLSSTIEKYINYPIEEKLQELIFPFQGFEEQKENKLGTPIMQLKAFEIVKNQKNNDSIFDFIILFKTQIAKQIIKHQFKLQICCIKDMELFLAELLFFSCIDFNISILNQLMIINSESKLLLIIEKFIARQKILKQEQHFYIQNLLFLKKFGNQQIQSILFDEIAQIIKNNPQLLVHDYSNLNKQLQYPFLILVEQDDQQLNDICLNFEINIESEKQILEILKCLLKLNKFFGIQNKVFEQVKKSLQYEVTVRIDNKAYVEINSHNVSNGVFSFQNVLNLYNVRAFQNKIKFIIEELKQKKNVEIYFEKNQFLQHFFEPKDSYKYLYVLSEKNDEEEVNESLKIFKNCQFCFTYSQNWQLNQKLKLLYFDKNEYLQLTNISLQEITLEQCEYLYDFWLSFPNKYYHKNFYCDKIKKIYQKSQKYLEQFPIDDYIRPATYSGFKLINIKNCFLNPQNYKQRVIIHQIKYQTNFLQTLLLYPECAQDYFKYKESLFSIPKAQVYYQIKTIAQNNAISNIIILNQLKDTTSQSNLFSYLIGLAKEYFIPYLQISYQKEELSDYNMQFKKIVTQLSPILPNEFDLNFYGYSLTCSMINHLEDESFVMLIKSLPNSNFLEIILNNRVISVTSLQKQAINLIYQMFQYEIKHEKNHNIYQPKNFSIEGLCFLVEKILMNIDFEQYWIINQLDANMEQIFDKAPHLVIEYYLKSKRYKETKYFPTKLYLRLMEQKDEINIFRILRNFKLKSYSKVSYLFKDDYQIDRNFLLAINFPPCLVLNFQQFSKYLDIDQMSEQFFQEILGLLLKSGLFEKIRCLIQKFGSFSRIQDKENLAKSIVNIILSFKLQPCKQKLMMIYLKPEKIYLNIPTYNFFYISGEVTCYNKKRIQQKHSETTLLEKAIKKLDSRNIQLNKEFYENLEFAKLHFCQNEMYAKQNQNFDCLFQQNINLQQCDMVRSYNIVQNWAGLSALKGFNNNFEVIDALFSPEKKLIRQKDALLKVLAEGFEQKILTYKNFKQHSFQNYIILIKFNCVQNFKNYFTEDFTITKLDLYTQEIFVNELIIQKLIYEPSSFELEYIVFYLKIQHQNLIPVLKKNFNGCTVFHLRNQLLKFSATSLYYAKNGINLLPQQFYDLSKMKSKKAFQRIQKKILYLKNFLKIENLQLNQMSPEQVYVLYRSHDHIIENKKIDYNFLALAILSGSYETILYVLNFAKSPLNLKKEQEFIVSSQCIFQLLVIYQFKEQQILDFFNRFVLSFQNARSAFFIKDKPLLYYIILFNQHIVFKECYLPMMKKSYQEFDFNIAIHNELSFQVLDQLEILGLALQQKNYGILKFSENIIQKNHLYGEFYFDIKILHQEFQQDDLQGKFLALYQRLFHLVIIIPMPYSMSEFTNFEKACLSYLFNLNLNFYFRNKFLTLELSQNKLQTLKTLRYNPYLLDFLLKQYYQENKTFNIDDDLFSEIITNSLNYQDLTHGIFVQLAEQNASLFLQIVFENSLSLLTIQLIITLFQRLKIQQNLDLFQEKVLQLKDSIYQKDQALFFTASLFLSIYQDEYKDWLKNYNIETLQYIYQFLMKQDLFHQQQAKPYFTDSSNEFLLKLIREDIQLSDYELFQNIVNEQSSKERAIVISIIYIEQINNVVSNFIEKLNSAGIILGSNFNQYFLVYIGKGFVSYSKDGGNFFILPIEFVNNSFCLPDESIQNTLSLLKIENFYMNIESELEKFQYLQNLYPKYDFSSITSLDLQEFISQTNEQSDIFEKCFFFKHLIEEEFKDSGIYEIDDVSAPHQNEQTQQIGFPLIQDLTQSQYQLSSQSQHQKQQSLVKKQQTFKEDFQFMFELLPNNTYRIRQSKFQRKSEQIIFVEFYQFIKPEVIIDLKLLTECQFKETYTTQTIITFIISDLYRYSEYLSSLLEKRDSFQWTNVFPFYLKDQLFYYQKELFSTYCIQMIQNKTLEFIQNIQFVLDKNENRGEFNWRINIISFFEVFISKIVEIEGNQKQSVISLMEQIFAWESLTIILHQILYKNLINAQSILKVIRGVYVEFNDLQTDDLSDNINLQGLDKIFQFGKTTYLLYYNILIVRLNVYTNLNQGLKLAQNRNQQTYYENNQIKTYYSSIVNELDFYNQIFLPEQLVQYFFNKLEIDRILLNYSNQLSKLYKKTIIISVDHQSLATIYCEEIQRIIHLKNGDERQGQMKKIQLILYKLKNYFQEELYSYLENQIKEEKINEYFYVRLFCIILALQNHVPLNELIQTNARVIDVKQGEAFFNQFLFKLKVNETKLSFYFGFQVSKKFYMNFNKLGDIVLIVVGRHQRNDLEFCQLVCNDKPDQFLFYNLQSRNSELLTKEKILQNQDFYKEIKDPGQVYQIIETKDLISVIIFQQQWPADSNFNENILNVFLTDRDAKIFQLTVNYFQQKMMELQAETDEQLKEKLFADTFAVEDMDIGSNLSIHNIIPMVPNEINFEFSCCHQLKKQKSNTCGKNFGIRINNDKFEIDRIQPQQLAMACYFQSSQLYINLMQDFKKFISQNPEIPKIELIFDDSLNSNPLEMTNFILGNFNIFEAFQEGYKYFQQTNFYPKMQASLQMLFQIKSVDQLKKLFIKLALKNIKFIFEKQFDDNKELIQFSDNSLRLFTLLSEKGVVNFPDESRIFYFLSQLIVDFECFQLNQIITQNQFQIILSKNIPLEEIQQATELVLISKYFYRLMKFKNKKLELKIYILNQKEIKVITSLHHVFYQQADANTLIINYTCFQDFNFSDFLLDCLNNEQYQNNDRYDKHFLYSGPQILYQAFSLYPITYFKGNNNANTKISLIIFDSNSGEEQQVLNLEPEKFRTLFLVFIIDDKYIFNQVVVSYLNPILQGYIQQQQERTIAQNSSYFIIKDLQYEKPLKQLKSIFWQEYNKKQVSLQKILTQQSVVSIKYKIFTNNLLLIEVFSSKVFNVKIISKQANLSFKSNLFAKKINIQFYPLYEQDLRKTVHVSRLQNGQKQLIDLEKKIFQIGYGDKNFIKLLLQNQKTADQDFPFFNHENSEFNHLELQSNNIINMLSKQEIYAATRAGEERVDEIEFRDSNDNKITNFKFKKVIFVHSLFNQVYYTPKETIKLSNLLLRWTPVYKGVYNLFIDEVFVNGQFVVLANAPCKTESFVEVSSDLLEISQFENIPFSFLFKDKYSNIYGDIELLTYDDCKYDIQISGENIEIHSNLNKQKIEKRGQLTAMAYFKQINDNQSVNQFQVNFNLNYTSIKKLNLKVSGISLEKRKQYFDNELLKIKIYGYNLTIKRINFLSELFEIREKQLNYKFCITFEGEQGSDAGGLTREFYDMIGKSLKDEKFKFFAPIQEHQNKFFLHKSFNQRKKKEQYALLFGKLIANSIVNKELIDIDIISPFWKVVYGENIVFEDLKMILEAKTFLNYQQLKSMKSTDFDMLEIDFTYQVGNASIELIPKGQSIQVTIQNVDDYLNKTAEYIIFKQFEDIYKSFIQGFSSILDIAMIKRWIRPSEISFLTSGLTEIKPETILQKTNYEGGKPCHKSYFENYVNQADCQTLKNMLKFITGTPAIPYDSANYQLTIKFLKELDVIKLPLGHTCFKSLDVPLYNNFGQMKQKFDVAFHNGLEGFGFV